MKHYFSERLWLVFAILAALCRGVWGILAKFISSDISPYVNQMLCLLPPMFQDEVYKAGEQVVPGRVQCALFDLGGEGVGYHDNPINNELAGDYTGGEKTGSYHTWNRAKTWVPSPSKKPGSIY